ncbi:MAG TPA: carboxyl transferase [Candidatus Avilachnospira avicola]|nr:carboxyl transferase [Candidatus Avilachnospira avicola]
MSYNDTTAHKRIASILDEGSFVEIGAYVTARDAASDPSEEAYGDGVVTGYGTIGGCLMYVYAQNPDYAGGSLGEMHAAKIAKIYDLAMDMGAPVLALLDCAGVRLSEGIDSLQSFGTLFRNQSRACGAVPQITVVYGNCGGGLAVSAAMSDFVFMAESAKLFLTSPNAVKGNYEGKCDTAAAKFQSEKVGVCDAVGSEAEIAKEVKELVAMLPENYLDDFSATENADSLNRSVAGIDKADKAEMIRMIADDGKFFEVKKDYGKEVVAGLIRIGGNTVGVVANADGKLGYLGARKAEKLISFCDSFGIPVLTLADVDGFWTCEENERNLSVRLAELIDAYSAASVPMVTVVTGHAYGTAGIAMGSKSLGADVVYAWKSAKVGLMDESLLKDIDESFDKSKNTALYSAKRGYVDDIIDPAETRQRVAAALEMLYTKAFDA